jgi:hypothetical protein
MIPPARSTLERLVASIASHAQDTLLEAMTAQLPLTLCQTIDRLRMDLYARVDTPTLRTAIRSCRTWQRLEDRGFIDELRGRYPHLKRYLPTFLTLPFAATPGMQPLRTALDLARRLYTGALKAISADAPLPFVPAAGHRALWQESGQLDRRVWELALAFAVRDDSLLSSKAGSACQEW